MKDSQLPLRHMLDAISSIERYLEGKEFEDLTNDRQLWDSVLMNLVIIGEEANYVSDAVKEDNPDIPWRKMVGTRNLISHDYFSVKPEIVWNTVKKELSKLKALLLELL